jgi:zinc and cadmium transporter
MLENILLILTSTILVSLISLIGVITILFKKDFFKKILAMSVAFAAGSMLGASFFDILPESLKILGKNTFFYILTGILIFFIVERYIHWHHCHRYHEQHAKIQPSVYLNLIGDGVHNFIDGTIIAASFLTNLQVGIISTIAIASHEIPQEIGDFGILIKGGLKPRKVLFFNLLSALLSVIGGLITIFSANIFQNIIPILLSIAGGGFIYLSLVDIVPDLHKEIKTQTIILEGLSLFIGILTMFFLTKFLPG